ncbi:NAD(P)/FAD-dependent oxidoreductase [Flavobacterium arcticum]|uniref:NAD(P)/FAD-dependent oxidoreductase n=1 Tax=Flavobacterium arcticum TaxID=1784713 RepID=A0A345HC38_9FLAO|nr:NAD(P)/FAD-dependent oxidoreductase [Flavobacterium arcticum]AXG74148.1 NAD(P)/FAD-dependent oxidoreductase [Flavobacterium arcticum]KAF2507293.1 NAD(P)/FAD-dependent oxidoreductase [Flavobacterium arcticum]
MSKSFDIIIAGGGAAGFFIAINIAEANPNVKIAILERGKEVLSKVRISGGGRCNVTHACFIPNDLVKFYPRGEKELRGPFNRFCSGDTIEWFERHGVALKIEEDGRMFPVTDSSQTIIDCFQDAVKKLGIQVITGQSIQSIFKAENHWKIDTQSDTYLCETLVMTTGSNPKMWQMLEEYGHTIVPPVPSLFTFNIKDNRIKNLMGVAALASVKVRGSKLEASGPLLITHWGMSGPGILRLSAWGARELAAKNYQFILQVNWLDDVTHEECLDTLKALKQEQAKKLVAKKSPFDFPNRLWESLATASGIDDVTRWADLSGKQLNELASQLVAGEFQVNGKSTFKEEFVTAGGVELKEVNFKTMESKIVEKLYFAGEILNIDAITGGFNFQNAWTGGFIAAEAISNR